MQFVVIEAASAKEKWADLAAQEYTQKISHFVKFQIDSCKSSNNSRDSKNEKINCDSQSLLQKIKNEDYVIVLDERGESLNSQAWSKMIQNVLNSGKKRTVFVVGGAYGVNADVLKRAQKKVSLAPFVLNHLVARTVLLEQIYRAFTIIKGLPYHND